jgi:hypothetical protein
MKSSTLSPLDTRLDVAVDDEHLSGEESSPLSSPVSSSSSETKDRRAYEHVRHKVKKSADTRKLKAQKKSPNRYHGWYTPRRDGTKGPGADLVDGPSVRDTEEDEGILVDNGNNNIIRPSAETQHALADVKLADLVVTAASRKPNKRQGMSPRL